MAKNTPDDFFRRLTNLFRSGPAIRRKIKGYDYKSNFNNSLIAGSYGNQNSFPGAFGHENSPFSTLGNYGILDRMSAYSEYASMDYTPEIAAALNVYADETFGGDDRGKSFHIYSNNPEIKKALEELFYDVMNIEFNGRMWVRNLCKNGDTFLFNDVVPDVGIINVTPIPVNEIEREEGYDPEDPYAYRFKWLTRGNQYLEPWQMTHIRLLGSDLFLPYGMSIIEPARRVWRQIVLTEDAMLLYRVLRAGDRRVIYVDIGNTAPNDIPSVMEKVKATFRSNNLIDKQTGRMDMRLNPLSVIDDVFIPVRGNQQGTRIETLNGGSNATAIEDVEYLQKKLFASLIVPKPFLNFDENLSSKATLSQADIRFSRTVAQVQKTVIAEMNKIAMIHLYAIGFDGEDLIDFELKLSNPSTVALQQRLEIWSQKFDIAGSARETGLADVSWIQKNILEFSEEEIKSINKGLIEDKVREVELEAVAIPDEQMQLDRTVDPFDPSNYETVLPGSDLMKSEPIADTQNINIDAMTNQYPLIDSEDEEEDNPFTSDNSKSPIKPSPVSSIIKKNKENRKRRVGLGGRSNLSNPDFRAMLSPSNKYTKDVFGIKHESTSLKEAIKNTTEHNKTNNDDLFDSMASRDIENFIKREIIVKPLLTKEMKNMFKKFDNNYGIKHKVKHNGILTEELYEDIEITIEDVELEENILTESSSSSSDIFYGILKEEQEQQQNNGEKDDMPKSLKEALENEEEKEE